MNEELQKKKEQLIRRNRRFVWLSRNWAPIAVVFLTIYVSLPFAAPTLMRLGATGPADVLYTIYSPLCHQFAFRSQFLFGEQSFYPREAAEDPNRDLNFDERAAQSESFQDEFRDQLRRSQGDEVAEAFSFDQDALSEWTATMTLAARNFRGDEEMGYKVALCARDIAIYGAMVIGGIGFLFVRKRLRPAPILLYVLLGLGPIGIDGFSQLLSYPPFEFWEVRETLPEFRVLTGALFGLMNVWLAFPYLERSMQESADAMEANIERLR